MALGMDTCTEALATAANELWRVVVRKSPTLLSVWASGPATRYQHAEWVGVGVSVSMSVSMSMSKHIL